MLTLTSIIRTLKHNLSFPHGDRAHHFGREPVAPYSNLEISEAAREVINNARPTVETSNDADATITADKTEAGG